MLEGAGGRAVHGEDDEAIGAGPEREREREGRGGRCLAVVVVALSPSYPFLAPFLKFKLRLSTLICRIVLHFITFSDSFIRATRK